MAFFLILDNRNPEFLLVYYGIYSMSLKHYGHFKILFKPKIIFGRVAFFGF